MHKSKLRANIASSGSWSIAPTDETKKGFFMEFEIKPWVENITADDMPNDDLRFIAEKARKIWCSHKIIRNTDTVFYVRNIYCKRY